MFSRSRLVVLLALVALCELTGSSVVMNLTRNSDAKHDELLLPSNNSISSNNFTTTTKDPLGLDIFQTKFATNDDYFKHIIDQETAATTPPQRTSYRIVWVVIVVKIIFLSIYIYAKCSEDKSSAPVIVTSTTTHTANPGPYPVSVQATPGGGFQATPYPTGGGVMPMPQPQMMQTNVPYPTHGGAMPQPYGDAVGYPSNPPYPVADPSRMNPPSYDQVVSGEATQKQAPYNPHYMGN